MATGLWVRAAGSWHEAKSFHVRASGSWHPAKGAWVKAGGTWHKFWPVNDPLTKSYYPTWSNAYMYDTGGKCIGSVLSGVRDDDLICGYWTTTQGSVPGPAGTWDHVTSIIRFGGLATDLATRPVIKSATLRLTGKVNYGGTGAALGVKLGTSNVTNTKPTTKAHTHTDIALQTFSSLWVGTGGEDDTKTLTLGAAMRDALEQDQAISIHDSAHGTSEEAKRSWRGVLEGGSAATASQPMLTVTMDYV